jgi:hypothetical protein
VIRRLPAEVVIRQRAELGVDEREELLGGCMIAQRESFQNLSCDLF